MDIQYKQSNLILRGHGIISNALKRIVIPCLNKQPRGWQIIMKHLTLLMRLKMPNKISAGIISIDCFIKIIKSTIQFNINKNSAPLYNFEQFRMTSLFNHILRFAEDMTQHSKSEQAFNFFDDCVREIYEGKIGIAQISNLRKKIDFQIGYGTLYTIIRQRLQKVCKNHRSLINNSAAVLGKSHSNYYRANAPPNGQIEQQNLKIQETISCIIYYNYQKLANANKLVCELWDAYKNPQIQQFSMQSGIKTPELKLATLNLLVLKQLIPTSEHVNISCFKQILLKLKNSIFVTKKDYIQQLLDVYRNQPIHDTKDLTKNNSELKITAQNQKTIQNSKTIKNNVQSKNNSQTKNNKTQFNENKDLLKMLKEQKERKAILDKYRVSFGEFCIFDESQSDKNEKNIFQQLAKKSFLNISLNGQEGSQLRIIKSTYQIKLSQNSEGIEIVQKNQQCTPNKKKKRKNKKKKGKQVQSDHEEQNKKQRDTFFQNKEELKQCCQTIKFLQQLTIDDEKRVNCKVKEIRNFTEWKKWAQLNMNVT